MMLAVFALGVALGIGMVVAALWGGAKAEEFLEHEAAVRRMTLGGHVVPADSPSGQATGLALHAEMLAIEGERGSMDSDEYRRVAAGMLRRCAAELRRER